MAAAARSTPSPGASAVKPGVDGNKAVADAFRDALLATHHHRRHGADDDDDDDRDDAGDDSSHRPHDGRDDDDGYAAPPEDDAAARSLPTVTTVGTARDTAEAGEPRSAAGGDDGVAALPSLGGSATTPTPSSSSSAAAATVATDARARAPVTASAADGTTPLPVAAVMRPHADPSRWPVDAADVVADGVVTAHADVDADADGALAPTARLSPAEWALWCELHDLAPHRHSSVGGRVRKASDHHHMEDDTTNAAVVASSDTDAAAAATAAAAVTAVVAAAAASLSLRPFEVTAAATTPVSKPPAVSNTADRPTTTRAVAQRLSLRSRDLLRARVFWLCDAHPAFADASAVDDGHTHDRRSDARRHAATASSSSSSSSPPSVGRRSAAARFAASAAAPVRAQGAVSALQSSRSSVSSRSSATQPAAVPDGVIASPAATTDAPGTGTADAGLVVRNVWELPTRWQLRAQTLTHLQQHRLQRRARDGGRHFFPVAGATAAAAAVAGAAASLGAPVADHRHHRHRSHSQRHQTMPSEPVGPSRADVLYAAIDRYASVSRAYLGATQLGGGNDAHHLHRLMCCLAFVDLDVCTATGAGVDGSEATDAETTSARAPSSSPSPSLSPALAWAREQQELVIGTVAAVAELLQTLARAAAPDSAGGVQLSAAQVDELWTRDLWALPDHALALTLADERLHDVLSSTPPADAVTSTAVATAYDAHDTALALQRVQQQLGPARAAAAADAAARRGHGGATRPTTAAVATASAPTRHDGQAASALAALEGGVGRTDGVAASLSVRSPFSYTTYAFAFLPTRHMTRMHHTTYATQRKLHDADAYYYGTPHQPMQHPPPHGDAAASASADASAAVPTATPARQRSAGSNASAARAAAMATARLRRNPNAPALVQRWKRRAAKALADAAEPDDAVETGDAAADRTDVDHLSAAHDDDDDDDDADAEARNDSVDHPHAAQSDVATQRAAGTPLRSRPRSPARTAAAVVPRVLPGSGGRGPLRYARTVPGGTGYHDARRNPGTETTNGVRNNTGSASAGPAATAAAARSPPRTAPVLSLSASASSPAFLHSPLSLTSASASAAAAAAAAASGAGRPATPGAAVSPASPGPARPGGSSSSGTRLSLSSPLQHASAAAASVLRPVSPNATGGNAVAVPPTGTAAAMTFFPALTTAPVAAASAVHSQHALKMAYVARTTLARHVQPSLRNSGSRHSLSVSQTLQSRTGDPVATKGGAASRPESAAAVAAAAELSAAFGATPDMALRTSADTAAATAPTAPSAGVLAASASSGSVGAARPRSAREYTRLLSGAEFAALSTGARKRLLQRIRAVYPKLAFESHAYVAALNVGYGK